MKATVFANLLLVCFIATVYSVNGWIHSFDHIHPPNIHRAHVFEFPHHVAVVRFDTIVGWKIICQGALITKVWFITSAYCIWSNLESLNNNNTMAVMATLDVNDPDSTSRRLSFFVYHPQFNERTGQGTDIAIWMITLPVVGSLLEKPTNLYEITESIVNDCVYSTYIKYYLYGDPGKLLSNRKCEMVGIPTDANSCVVLTNSTLHRILQRNEIGSPLVCGKKLYAIMNGLGYFTTVTDIMEWVLKVIEKGPIAVHDLIHNHRVRYKEFHLLFDTVEQFDIVNKRKNNPRLGNDDYSWEFFEKPFYNPYNTTFIESEEFKKLTDWLLGMTQKPDIDVKANNYNSMNDNEFDRPPTWHSNTRMRRNAVKSDKNTEMEYLFIGWAKLVSTLPPFKRYELKRIIGGIVNDAELNTYIDESKNMTVANATEFKRRYSIPSVEQLDLVNNREAKLKDVSEMEHLFLSWAKTISKLVPRKQIALKSSIGQIIEHAEALDSSVEYSDEILVENITDKYTSIENNTIQNNTHI